MAHYFTSHTSNITGNKFQSKILNWLTVGFLDMKSMHPFNLFYLKKLKSDKSGKQSSETHTLCQVT